MGFLDKIQTNTGANKPNPAAAGLFNKNKPTEKKSPFGKKNVGETSGTKTSPFGKKAVEAQSKKEEVKQEVKPTEKKTLFNKKSTNKAVEEKPVDKEKESKQETTKKAEEVPKQEVKEPEIKKEEPKTAKTNTRKKAEKVVVDAPEAEGEKEFITNFNDAAVAVKVFTNDKVWEDFCEQIKGDLKAIVISYDMNSTDIKTALEKLNALRDTIGFEYQQTKAEYENLTAEKPEGLIEIVKKTAYNEEDKNDFDRKRTSIIACQVFLDKTTGKFIDLFALAKQYKIRYEFLRYAMQSLDFKQQCLVTMNSAINHQGDIANHTAK